MPDQEARRKRYERFGASPEQVEAWLGYYRQPGRLSDFDPAQLSAPEGAAGPPEFGSLLAGRSFAEQVGPTPQDLVTAGMTEDPLLRALRRRAMLLGKQQLLSNQ